MGAWSQLDTLIEITFDEKDIDEAITIYGQDEAFSEVTDYLRKLRKAFLTASEQSAEDLSKRLVSFQQQIISEVCDNPSGMLSTSIEAKKETKYRYLVGTTINHIYPLALEYGRGEVRPIRAKALAFYAPDEGVMTFSKGVSGLTFGKAEHGLIFRMRSKPAKPRPFVAPAYNKVKAISKGVVIRKIGENMKRIK